MRLIKTTLCICSLLIFLQCQNRTKDEINSSPEDTNKTHSESIEKISYKPLTLTLKEANNLAKLPLKCVVQEYPNKLNQTIGSNEDLKSPKALHPAFYGCFDWHSSVHGHWSLVALLKAFPNIENRQKIIEKLKTNITKETIAAEVNYFKGKYNSSYERTYGWAWLLKLAEELHTWDDPMAKELENNLQPLTDLIVNKYLEFLPKLNYPIRVGEHTNTAFGLAFAWDYANTTNHNMLKALIEKRAKDFYLNDTDCPITWEPSGFDFLSPCLEEAEVMARVLSKEAFTEWFNNFLPEAMEKDFTIPVGEVSDRTDGKLVHLDGVNFSRTWALLTIANKLEDAEHLKNLANTHISYSLPNLVEDDYEGGHWLGSFAIYALKAAK